MEKYEIGFKKKSFSLFYNGGEIWCEHLDSLYNRKDLLIQKFEDDLVEIKKPSTSSFVAINLAESDIDKEIIDMLHEGLQSIEKKYSKIVFVGLGFMMKHYTKKKFGDCGYSVEFIDDFEKAKHWLIG